MIIDIEAVKQQFDSLVEQGELFIGPTEPQVERHDGIDFEFRIVNHFKNKPQVSLDGKSRSTAQSARRPPPSDGSDIDHSDPAFFVADINRTHKLILNKFCVFRPQYILLTQDPTRRQSEPLTRQDWQAAWATLEALTSPHYVIFNGGIAAGSSRNHKHMQLLEMPQAPNIPLSVPDKLPYHHFKHQINPDASSDVASDISERYNEDIKQCRRLLKAQDEAGPVAHNVVLTKDWFVVIPRREPTVKEIDGHIVNAIGMLGLIWANYEQQIEGWKKARPARILSRLGIGYA